MATLAEVTAGVGAEHVRRIGAFVLVARRSYWWQTTIYTVSAADEKVTMYGMGFYRKTAEAALAVAERNVRHDIEQARHILTSCERADAAYGETDWRGATP